jgi:hypothetical protein
MESLRLEEDMMVLGARADSSGAIFWGIWGNGEE